MTKQEIKDSAVANGYVIGQKTDDELLFDIKFIRAAFGTADTELDHKFKSTCTCGLVHYFATGKPKAVNVVLEISDLLNGGATSEDIWAAIGSRVEVQLSSVMTNGEVDPAKL